MRQLDKICEECGESFRVAQKELFKTKNSCEELDHQKCLDHEIAFFKFRYNTFKYT